MSNTVIDFLNELDKHTAGDVRTDTYTRTLYSTDASIYQVMPYGVLIPRHTDDLHAAAELAAEHRVPLLPRTGGSSLAGQAVNKALAVDMTKHLHKVIELNTEERWVRVQPGIVLDELNRYLRPYGLQFGPDPASSNRAAMGGIVSNNSTGSHSIMYGMTADHVLGMNVLLADGTPAAFGPLTAEQLAQHQQKKGLEGEIYRRVNAMMWDTENQEIVRAGTPRHWRRCGGYNLDRLMPPGVNGINYHPKWPRDERFNLAKVVCGAEGTLSVITDIKLNLVPLPTKTAVAIVHFDELFAALQAVPALLELDPSAVELMDDLGLTMCREVPEYARLLEGFVEGEPTAILITEFYGETEAELRHKIDQLRHHLRKHVPAATAVREALDPVVQGHVWKVRKVGLGLLMSVRSDYKPIPFIEDAAVPVEHLADYVSRIQDFCNEIGTRVAYYAHASAGCVHVRPMINTKLAEEIEKLPQITSFSVELLGEYGGSFSSEHGDGRARSWLNEKFFGKPLYNLYTQLKHTFDPHGILNPGNIVEAGPMTENLRFGVDYRVAAIDTYLDFSDDNGFDRAVEMCNGAGVCRKTTADTMCPSFMATREEKDSTRGRANMLRAAMSGRLPADAFTGPDVKDALDLCISCKACKSECPSSVDMAKIKTEWLAHYHDEHGTPLRSRLFAHIETLSRLSSGPLAPLVNWGGGLGFVRRFMARQVGIGGERDLPQFAFTPFTRWFAKHKNPHPVTEGTVVLFNDTYNTYNYPQVAQAAVKVLEAAGFKVVLPGVTDSGRPALSKGVIGKAKRTAQTVIEKLAPHAQQGRPIIFIEPSEYSAVVDDYASLLPEEKARLRRLIDHCYTFEQYITYLAENGRLKLDFSPGPRRVLLHGHCHQKALIGTGPAHTLLSLPPDTAVEEVDSGCCGMAGSFGYETEHYHISMQMGKRRLLPAVRAADKQTFVVAAGVSCRQQIKDGAQRKAIHPAEFLLACLA